MIRSLCHAVTVVLWSIAGMNLTVVVVEAQVGTQLVEREDEPSKLLPLEVRWEITAPAAAAAAPVAVEGRVFVASHESWGDDKVVAAPTGHVTAFSLVDGSELWQVLDDVATALTVGNGNLYIASGTVLRARDATSGAVRWSLRLDAPLSAPLVWNNGWLMVALASEELLALRAETGEVIWRNQLEGQIRSAPALAGREIFVSLDTGAVISLSLMSGETRWERQLDGEPQDILPAGDLFLGSTDNYFYALTAHDGSIRWRWQAGGDIVGRPFVDDGRVYFSSLDNVLWALNRSNGVQRWRQPLSVRPTSGPDKLQDLLIQGGRSAGVSFFGPSFGTRYGDASAPAELAFPPLILSNQSDDGPLLILTTGDGQLRAFSSATGPVRLGLAATRRFGEGLTNYYPYDLPRLSALEISSAVFHPCFFQLCEPVAGTDLSPCFFQSCELLAGTNLSPCLFQDCDPAESFRTSLFLSGVDPQGLLLRWSSREVDAGLAPLGTESTSKPVPADGPMDYAVLAALANRVTAEWLVGRLIGQGYSATVLETTAIEGGDSSSVVETTEANTVEGEVTEGGTRRPFWVYVGAYPSLPIAETVGGQMEREHLVDWYVVRLLRRRPTSWVW